MDKVTLVNMTDIPVTISLPELRFRREWAKKGQRISIPMDIMQEAVYNTGFSNILKLGYLQVIEKDARIELGIQEENENDPIMLTDKQIDRLLRTAPIKELKDMCANLPKSQITSIAQYAIDHEIATLDKCDYLKKACGVDILKTIDINRQIKQA